MKGIAILGSTGSIGRQTLDILRAFPQHFRLVGLAGWTNLSLLKQQADQFRPELVSYQGIDPKAPSHLLGHSAPTTLEAMVCHPSVEVVVMAIAGPSCLLPTLQALQAGKTVALASKEAMVMAGPVIARMVGKGATLLPVDSEPSAIWQCLQGEPPKDIARLILTASGGPFRGRPAEELASVTAGEALKHPTWSMGKKITIDSATLMNKALEVMESRWMFNVPWEGIEVVLHPQSIVHSLVEFRDGSVKAQLGLPDMRLPLQYALFYPQRVDNPSLERLDITRLGSLDFLPLDTGRYPCFTLGLEAAKAGGTYPAALCAADDIAVGLFLAGRLGFMEIPTLIQRVLDEHTSGNGDSVEDILAAESWARRRAQELAMVNI